MKEVKIYENWKEFLEDREWWDWKSEESPDLYFKEISIDDLLARTDIFYERLSEKETDYIHIFSKGSFAECLVRDVGLHSFFLIFYDNGKCSGKAYFSKEEAEEELKQIATEWFYRYSIEIMGT